ncbi:unnamed protein product [Lactuca virosa]|uniref:Uncharacterized protein n=1 Tax=Lactuca virosa TaxID=75947 RepID=A0AAU9LW39_9ASTR|nr:unnamed protein product [Lactuca virosa]
MEMVAAAYSSQFQFQSFCFAKSINKSIIPGSVMCFKPSSKSVAIRAIGQNFQHCFTKKEDEYMYCEVVKVQEVLDAAERTPFYLYSRPQITRNIEAYKHMRKMGRGAVVFNGNELRLTIDAGFDPSRNSGLLATCCFKLVLKLLRGD